MSTEPHRLRIGILGCANIARQHARDVAPGCAVSIVAVEQLAAQAS
jgi:predicted dehydrogenase